MDVIKELMDNKYRGISVRSICTNPEFRNKVMEDETVRGNFEVKKLVLEKLAVGGKVLLTGPTGEAKTLFAQILLNHIISEINSYKYHIDGCPFYEDAGYIIHVIENYTLNIANSVRVLQSLCPFCRENITNLLNNKNMNVSLDNTQQMLEIKNLDEILTELPVAKTIVRKMQLDPRNDPESLYMLLAGVENLEQLLGGESNESFAAKSHKVGALSQGFMVVNEIQRLHLSLLESLMGFLEDPQGIKYNLAGETVYVDGAIIFTSNSPLTVFGEESQPIINRVPEVLWPARDVKNRVEIVKDMFEDHMVTSKVSITSNPSLIKMFETNGKSEKDFISRLALEFISNVSNDSIPPSLKSTSARSENRVARSDFYNGLDEIHNPQRSPHIDLRTLNNAIGEIVIRSKENANEEGIIVTLDTVKESLEIYDISPTLINNGLQAVKLRLRNALRSGETAVNVDDVKEELDKLTSLTDDELKKIIFDFEDLNNKEQSVAQYLFERLKPSYESLLQVAYL